MGSAIHAPSSRFANLYIRTHYFKKAGDKHRGHLHQIDHVTVLMRGAVQVRFGPEGSEVREYRVFDDPALGPLTRYIEIDKDVYHQLTALEDHTVYACVFSLAAHLTDAERASAQAGMCDNCSDGSGCSPLVEAMATFGDGSRTPA